MTNNSKEKSLIPIKKKNIFLRIFDFFIKPFNKEKQDLNNNFINIDLPDNKINRPRFSGLDPDEIKFQNFRKGIIKEEDLTLEEKNMIINKYKEKIIIEKQQIEYLKRKILDIKNKKLKKLQT